MLICVFDLVLSRCAAPRFTECISVWLHHGKWELSTGTLPAWKSYHSPLCFMCVGIQNVLEIYIPTMKGFSPMFKLTGCRNWWSKQCNKGFFYRAVNSVCGHYVCYLPKLTGSHYIHLCIWDWGVTVMLVWSDGTVLCFFCLHELLWQSPKLAMVECFTLSLNGDKERAISNSPFIRSQNNGIGWTVYCTD